MTRYLGLVALLVAASCDSPAQPVNTVTPVLANTSAWQGGYFTIRNIAPADSAPSVFADSIPAALISRGGDSAVYKLPGDRSGLVQIAVVDASRVIGTLQVAGVISITSPWLDPTPARSLGCPFPWLVDGKAEFVAAANGNIGATTRVVKYSLATGAVDTLRSGTASLWFRVNMRAPVMTADPHVFGFDTGNTVAFFRFPEALRVDTPPAGDYTNRRTAILASGAWVKVFNHFISTPAFQVFGNDDEDSPGMAISPDGQHVAVASNSSEGVPMFGPDGGLMWRYAKARIPYSVSFDLTGSSLYVGNATFVAELRANARGELIQLDVATGHLIKSLDLGLNVPYHIVPDPAGRWLYVQTDGEAHRQSLTIIDAKTFTVAGRIPLEVTSSFCLITLVGSEGIFVVGREDIVRIGHP